MHRLRCWEKERDTRRLEMLNRREHGRDKCGVVPAAQLEEVT
jgi:hypothetical protein